MDCDQDLRAREKSDLVRVHLRRGQSSCADRQGELLRQPGWLLDAYEKRPDPARLEIFQSAAEVTLAHLRPGSSYSSKPVSFTSKASLPSGSARATAAAAPPTGSRTRTGPAVRSEAEIEDHLAYLIDDCEDLSDETTVDDVGCGYRKFTSARLWRASQHADRR